MKVGDNFTRTHRQMLDPLVGHIVDIKGEDGTEVTARITNVFDDNVTLKVVPNSTKD